MIHNDSARLAGAPMPASRVFASALRSRHRAIEIGAAALTLGWAVFATMGANDRDRDAARALDARAIEVARLNAEVATMRRDVSLLDSAVRATAARVETRQAALAQLIGGAPVLAAIPAGATQTAALPAAQAALLAPLARVEGMQLAMIAQATTAAEARYRGATGAMRALGINPARFVRESRIGLGGPREDAGGSDAGAPAMRDLYQAWNRLQQLGEAATAIPARPPVANFTYTSGFGIRYDPFSGAAAMHAGIDMAGAHGEPIRAAAAGTVVRSGWQGGYGNLIEIDHGRGFITRYGHLARVRVRAGDRVEAGELVGAMGSTGRSTGTHLHFEVRLDGRAVDPMPYLRAAPTIAALQATPAAIAGAAQGGPLMSPAASR